MTFLRQLLLAVALAVPLTGAAVGARAADIVDTAASTGQFETLVAAVKAAGLLDTLKGEGPFTVFAPTDEAFDAFPDATIDTLLMPKNRKTLVALLTYHVVPGRVLSRDFAGKVTETATVEGRTARIDGTGKTARIDYANIVMPDIETSNGVIHAIDAVILPH